ncbi:energy transducer TonB [Paraburkholderia ginsengiterrae]|nr:energy transducer TonB [Paraburkholderia ginsengiterrae]
MAVNLPVRVAACRLPPQSPRLFDDLRGTRTHAIALVMLAIHCTIAFEAWRVAVEKVEYTAPRALDLLFDVRAANPEPVMTEPERPSSSSPRRSSEMATPKNTAQSLPSKPLPKTAQNHASRRQPAPPSSIETSAPPPASTHADGEPLTASAAKPPDVQPLPEQLTEPSFGAAYLRNPPPSYPGVAQQRGWQGTVLLKVHVDASGRPDHVGLASSSGHDSLDDAAIEAVTNWRFVPARRGDLATDGWVQVPIVFKLGT